MLIRKHKQSDIPSISRLYYDTIHLVNRWDYTEEQLNAWAPRIYDDAFWRERYGRIVGFVLVDGKDINLVQLKAGMAWFYRYYQKELSRENRKLYTQAEDEARANKRGLWQDKNPMPLWEHRRLHRSQ